MNKTIELLKSLSTTKSISEAQEIKAGDLFDLREKTYEAEDEVKKLAQDMRAWLPGEDAMLDAFRLKEPQKWAKKYLDSMQAKFDKLEEIKKAIQEYNKMP